MCESQGKADVIDLEDVALRKIFSECDEFSWPSSLSSSSSSSSPSISSEVPVSTLVEYIRENTRIRESADLLDELRKSLYEVSLDGQVTWPLFQQASRRWIGKIRHRLHREDGNNNVHRDSHNNALIENSNGEKELDRKSNECATIAGNESPLSSRFGNVDFMRLSNESSYSPSTVSTLGCDLTDTAAEMTEEAGVAEVELRLRVRRFDEENAMLREELVHAEESITDLRRQIDSLRHKLNQLGQRCALLEKENDEQKEMLSEAERKERLCKMSLQKAEKNRTTMIKKIEEIETEKQCISTLNAKLEKIAKEKIECAYHVAVIQEELDEKRAECELLQEKCLQLENNHANLQESYENTTCHLRNKIRDLKNQIVELQARHSDEYQQEDKLSLTPPIESVLHTFEHSTPCKIEEIQPEDSLCAELKASGFSMEYGRNSVKFQELEEELCWYNNEIRKTIEYLGTVIQELGICRDKRNVPDSCSPENMEDSKLSNILILRQKISLLSATAIETLRKRETRDSSSLVRAEPIAVAHLNEFKITNFVDHLRFLNEKKKLEIIENETSSSQGTLMTSRFSNNKYDSPFLISTVTCSRLYSLSVQEHTIIDPIVAALDDIIEGTNSQESSPRDHSSKHNPRSRFTYTLPLNRQIPEADCSNSDTSLDSPEQRNKKLSPVFVVSSKGDGIVGDVSNVDSSATTSEKSVRAEVDTNERKVQVQLNVARSEVERSCEDRSKSRFDLESGEFESDINVSESKLLEVSDRIEDDSEISQDNENDDDDNSLNSLSRIATKTAIETRNFKFNPDDLHLDLEKLNLRSSSSSSSTHDESPWEVMREAEKCYTSNDYDELEKLRVPVIIREIPNFKLKSVPKRKTSVFHRSFDISSLYDGNKEERINESLKESCVKRSMSSPSVENNDKVELRLIETPIVRKKILGPYRTVARYSESPASSPSSYHEGCFSDGELSIVEDLGSRESEVGFSFDLAPARLRISQKFDRNPSTNDALNKSWNDTIFTPSERSDGSFVNQRPRCALASGSMANTFVINKEQPKGKRVPSDLTFDVAVETSRIKNIPNLSSSLSWIENQRETFESSMTDFHERRKITKILFTPRRRSSSPNRLDSSSTSLMIVKNSRSRNDTSKRPRNVPPTGDDVGGNDDRDDCGSAIDVQRENPAVALAMSSGEDSSDSEVDLDALRDDRQVAPSIVSLDDKIVPFISGNVKNDSGGSACAEEREEKSMEILATICKSLSKNKSTCCARAECRCRDDLVDSNMRVANKEKKEEENEEEEEEDEDPPKIFPNLTDAHMRESGIAISSSDTSESGEKMSEDELERKYTALSVGLGTDRATLSRRMALSFRQRDQAERNLACEVQKMHQDIQALAPLCVDRESVERVERVRHQLEMIAQCAHRVSCAAETLGAAHQEHRISRAALLADRYLQLLRTRCEKLVAELAETKRILTENNIVLEENANELGDDIPRVRYRGMPSNNRSMISRRRASIATISRPLGGTQDIVKENTRQRNSVSGRMTLRRPSLSYETQKWENDKLCRTDSSSSIGELQDIFEQAESRRNSREENNNNLVRSQSSNFSIGSYESSDSNVWSSPREDPSEEVPADESICPESGFNQRTSQVLRMIRAYVPWVPMFWCILISFFLGFYVKHVVSSVNTCTGAPVRWWSIEEILDQYIQVRNVAPRPI